MSPALLQAEIEEFRMPVNKRWRVSRGLWRSAVQMIILAFSDIKVPSCPGSHGISIIAIHVARYEDFFSSYRY